MLDRLIKETGAKLFLWLAVYTCKELGAKTLAYRD